MFGRFALAGVALFSLTSFSTPSYARSWLRNVDAQTWADVLHVVVDAANARDNAGAPDYAPVRDYSSSSWYRNWLLSRQSGSGAALYNQPCTVSDGMREIVVPCQMVAIALNGGSVTASADTGSNDGTADTGSNAGRDAIALAVTPKANKAHKGKGKGASHGSSGHGNHGSSGHGNK